MEDSWHGMNTMLKSLKIPQSGVFYADKNKKWISVKISRYNLKLEEPKIIVKFLMMKTRQLVVYVK
eukprot:snap_masked-scaffold_46-processed-gene-0.38-mRNA-1 protein AED:1.00 eAED:1.00 QI:0/-1/0/0/-1/1/1/0/65